MNTKINHSALRFVVLKGAAGFGDRLQCLLQAFAYAKTSGRILVVDWRDQDWCHADGEGFDHYFRCVDIPTFRPEEFELYYQAHRTTLSVEPEAWRYLLHRTDHRSLVYKKLLGHETIGQHLHKVINLEIEDYDADVVVYGGVGFRGFRFTDLNHMRPQPWLEKILVRSFEENSLEAGQYDVVHLRGGSKSWAGGQVRLASHAKKIDEQFPTQESYLDFLYQKYQQASKNNPQRPLLLLTDMRALAEAWIKRFDCGQLIEDTFNEALELSGTHEISPESLAAAQQSVTKERLNVELLRDFNLLCSARHVIGDGLSIFSEIAAKAKSVNYSLA